MASDIIVHLATNLINEIGRLMFHIPQRCVSSRLRILNFDIFIWYNQRLNKHVAYIYDTTKFNFWSVNLIWISIENKNSKPHTVRWNQKLMCGYYFECRWFEICNILLVRFWLFCLKTNGNVGGMEVSYDTLCQTQALVLRGIHFICEL